MQNMWISCWVSTCKAATSFIGLKRCFALKSSPKTTLIHAWFCTKDNGFSQKTIHACKRHFFNSTLITVACVEILIILISWYRTDHRTCWDSKRISRVSSMPKPITLAKSKLFWWWCITIGLIYILDSVHNPSIFWTTMFCKHVLSSSSSHRIRTAILKKIL